MKSLVKLLIEKEGIRSTASIYISIILAYLDDLNWEEAQYIIKIMSQLSMEREEYLAYAYLKEIINQKNLVKLSDLRSYLLD